MTEAEARDRAAAVHGAAAVDRLDRFAAWVVEENGRQNLVAPSTLPTLWSRHIADSLQLVPLAPATGMWLDIGTGGGFPGLVVAAVRTQPTLLVEPRRKRADFLRDCCERLGLNHAEVAMDRVERVQASAAVISARAVASVENLLRAAAHCATPSTRWLLPRGTVDPAELATLLRRSKWMFHVEQSLTADASSIVVLEAR